MFSCFDTLSDRRPIRQTDGRTDILRQQNAVQQYRPSHRTD